MENNYNEQMLDFLACITLSDYDMLAVLNQYYLTNLVSDSAIFESSSGKTDAFLRDFSLVEESEVDASRDAYWCVFKNIKTGKYFKQTSLYNSYSYEPQYILSIWSQVKPFQVRQTHYMEV